MRLVAGVQVSAAQVRLGRGVRETVQSSRCTIWYPRRGDPVRESTDVFQHVIHTGEGTVVLELQCIATMAGLM